jgi:dihydroneopterin triphosphate diphosphatase
MARAPFQTLIIPFRRVPGRDAPEVAILLRQDLGVWQFAAGGGEDGETPTQAAAREAAEELGLTRPAPLYPLQTTGSIPARFFRDRDRWPAGTYVVPEHAFALDMTGLDITTSDEHTGLKWLDPEAAAAELRFDTNKTALGELTERLLADDLPTPAPTTRAPTPGRSARPRTPAGR